MAKVRNRSIKTRSGVSLRWRNGRLFVAVRLKGFPPQYLSFPPGTTEFEATEKGLEVARKLKLRDVPTLANKILKDLTTEKLIEEYQRECQIAHKISQATNQPAIIRGMKLKRSWENEDWFLNAFMDKEETLSRKPLDQATTRDFEDYRDRRLASGIKPDSFLREIGPLRYVYKLARKKYKISFDPFKELDLPEPGKGRDRLMSNEERTRLLKATEKCRTDKQGYLWRALILAALTTAARKGELLKLQWADLDFERNTLYFRAENTKSGNARLIPMSKALRDDLEAYRGVLAEKDKTPTSLVFPLTPSAHEQGWRRLCKRAHPPIKGLHFHDLKHTAMTSFASKPIELGTRQIAYIGDHKEGRMSSRYEHIEMVESIRARLDVGYIDKDDQNYMPRISEVVLPVYRRELKKFASEANKQTDERLKETVVVFKVENNYTRLTTVGVYKKLDAYKLIDASEVELEQLTGFHKGKYVWTNQLGEKHLVVDPAILSVESVLEELLGSPQAARRMLDGPAMIHKNLQQQKFTTTHST